MPSFTRIIGLGLVAASIAIGPATHAQTAAPDDWDALIRRLETAALADRTDVVKAERLACLRLLAGSPSPNQAALIRYTVAYAAWRLAFAQGLTDKEQSDLLNDADVQLHEAVRLNPRMADAWGLLSGVYGGKIAKAPDLGMTLGPQSSEVLARALGMEPNNPRLLVLKGEDEFHTPPEFGGSIKDAEATFRRAAALLDAQPASQPWPNWGRFDAHVWLGQALVARGDKSGARAQYEAALAIAPDATWVRFALLPAIK